MDVKTFSNILVDIESYFDAYGGDILDVYISRDFMYYLSKHNYVYYSYINFIIDENRSGINYGFHLKTELENDVVKFFDYDKN